MHPDYESEVSRVFQAAPFIASIGFCLEQVREGECITSLVIASRHLQQDGYVHAGVQATMADHTAGTAAASLLRPGQMVLSAEFKINLLRPARGERLRCHAKVLKAGSRLSVVESDVFCTAGDTSHRVAKATVTLVVLPAHEG